MNSIARERSEIERKGFLRPYERRFLLLAALVGAAWGVASLLLRLSGFVDQWLLPQQHIVWAITLPVYLAGWILPYGNPLHLNHISNVVAVALIFTLGALLLLVPAALYLGICRWLED